MQKQSGFTLIEVMVVVIIVGILASIAYPGYQEHVRRANRAEGQAFLQDVAARQERYFSQNNSYITDIGDIGKMGLNNGSSETGKYTLNISATDRYTLTAAPTFSDTKCGSLTLTGSGVRGVTSGDANYCWR